MRLLTPPNPARRHAQETVLNAVASAPRCEPTMDEELRTKRARPQNPVPNGLCISGRGISTIAKYAGPTMLKMRNCMSRLRTMQYCPTSNERALGQNIDSFYYQSPEASYGSAS